MPSRIAVLLLGMGLLSSPGFGTAWKEPTAAEKQIVEDPASGRVGAVYLEIVQESVDQVFHVSVRAKILSKTGYDVATVDDLDEDAFEIAGRTISPGGVVSPLAERDIRTMTTVKAAGYSLKRKGFTLPSLEPGCIVEYTYRENGSFGSQGAYHTEILFQRHYAILKQELRVPGHSPYSSAIRFEHGVRVQFRSEPGKSVYFSENAPPIHSEPFGLPENERAAGVIFSYFFQDLRASTAEEYWTGATRLGLAPAVKNALVRPSKLVERLKKIPGSRGSDAESRLRALYADVQTGLKNRGALAAGDTPPKGGWKKNDDAGDTLANGSGSSWDLTAAFLSLLRADGWRYRVVYCPDRTARLFRKEIPSIFQFDARIVEVRDPGLKGAAYLSFEHPRTPFGLVSWSHLDTDCYAVDPEAASGEVIQIPPGRPDENAERRTWKIGLADDGNISVEREARWSGQQGLEARTLLYREGRDYYEKDLRDRYRKLDPPGEVESLEIANEESLEKDFVSKIRFHRDGFGASLPGGRLAISPLALLGGTNPFTQNIRTEPIRFPYPHLDTDSLTISAPEGYAAEGLPRDVELSVEVGRYSVKLKRAGPNSVVVDRIFELRRASAGVEYYPMYRGLLEAAARTDADLSVVFKKLPPSPSGRGR